MDHSLLQGHEDAATTSMLHFGLLGAPGQKPEIFGALFPGDIHICMYIYIYIHIYIYVCSWYNISARVKSRCFFFTAGMFNQNLKLQAKASNCLTQGPTQSLVLLKGLGFRV